MMDGDLAGHPTHWRVWDRGGARPVLALHCAMAHGGAFAPMAEHLAGITLAAPDHPSHGKTAAWDGTGDLHDLATASAVALAERLGQGDALDVIGHSFGATVALRLALERPELIRSLTLIEPVLFAAARGTAVFDAFLADHSRIDDLMAQGRMDLAAAAFHAEWGAGPALADLPPHQRKYIEDRIGVIPALTPVQVNDRPGLTVPGRLEGFDRPVLLIEGDRSPPIIAAVQDVFQARLPRTRRVVVAGAGHMVPITHAADVARAVALFLQDGAGTGPS